MKLYLVQHEHGYYSDDILGNVADDICGIFSKIETAKDLIKKLSEAEIRELKNDKFVEELEIDCDLDTILDVSIDYYETSTFTDNWSYYRIKEFELDAEV